MMPRASVSIIAGKTRVGKSPLVILGLRDYTDKPEDEDNNKWEFPGGAIDEGELSQDAAIRELREETGIEVEAESLTLVAVHETGDWVSFIYGVDIDEGVDPQVMEPNKCKEWRWTAIDDLDALPRDNVVAALRKFLNNEGKIHEILTPY